MQRRKLLMAGLSGLTIGRPTYAAADDWHRTLGYPTGWGFRRDWTDKLYRIGNYSGGYETMFRTRTIRAGSGQASPLQGPGANSDAQASMSGSIAEYLKAWPVTGLLIARKGRIVFEQYQFDRTPRRSWGADSAPHRRRGPFRLKPHWTKLFVYILWQKYIYYCIKLKYFNLNDSKITLCAWNGIRTGSKAHWSSQKTAGHTQ